MPVQQPPASPPPENRADPSASSFRIRVIRAIRGYKSGRSAPEENLTADNADITDVSPTSGASWGGQGSGICLLHSAFCLPHSALCLLLALNPPRPDPIDPSRPPPQSPSARIGVWLWTHAFLLLPSSTQRPAPHPGAQCHHLGRRPRLERDDGQFALV